MDEEKSHFRHSLLFLWQKKFNAAAARRELVPVFGEGIISEEQIRRWFRKFENGDISLEDEPRSGRPIEVNDDNLLALIRDDPRANLRDLAQQLGCSHTTVDRHLTGANFSKKLGQWIPHQQFYEQIAGQNHGKLMNGDRKKEKRRRMAPHNNNKTNKNIQGQQQGVKAEEEEEEPSTGTPFTVKQEMHD